MNLKVTNAHEGHQEVEAAEYPQIRFVNTKVKWSGMPKPYMPGNDPWQVCTPKSTRQLSALGYFFGRGIHARLNVPIGLIFVFSRGNLGMAPASGFEGISELDECLDKRESAENEYFNMVVNNVPAIEQWVKNAKVAKAAGNPIPQYKVSVPFILLDQGAPSVSFNGMVSQYVPFAIRGVIWYQDIPETRFGANLSEESKLLAVINGWRKEWAQGDIPFLFCQVSQFRYNTDNSYVNSSYLFSTWSAMDKILKKLPNVGMAATFDIGEDCRQFEKPAKQLTGKRLASIALSETYSLPGIACKNPSFKDVKVEQGKMIIRLNNSGGALKTKDGNPVREFQIAARDGSFVEANADIRGDEIIVWSDKVNEPFSIKYAWHEQCNPNLMNNDSLPLLPFIYPQK